MNPHMVFAFPPAASARDSYTSAYFNMCLGSAYTISYLVQEGFTARAFLTDEPVNVQRGVVQLLAEKPRVVGFTVYDSNYSICQRMARDLKEADPGIIIIFGGPAPSVQGKAILKNNPGVDICVRHEGEETCLELLSLLEDKNFDLKKAEAFLETIRGITFRQGNHIMENPGRNVLLDNRNIPGFLDKYPSPYLTGVLNSFREGILTARGCNQHCVYCNCALMSKGMMATHSPDRVIEELAYIAKRFSPRPSDNVTIYDDAFTLIPGRALDLCHKIIENRIKLPLVGITRCDLVNEELLDSMKAAGFKAIGFSLESGVPHVLRKIGKVQPPGTRSDDNFEKEKEFIEKFKKYISYAKKTGFNYVFASIMIGLPGETPEEGQQSVDLIRSLEDRIDYYAHNFFKIYPGTPISFNYKKYGLDLVFNEDQVHSRTIPPYDIHKIPLAPKSNLEIDSIKQDRFNMKSLALLPSKKRSPDYFNKIILGADVITGDLISWLQKYLAVNGPVIQVYSSAEQARQWRETNEHTLRKYIPPTLSYMSYYETHRENGTVTLTPLKMDIYGRQCGITIDMVNTRVGLSPSPIKPNPWQSICIDREEEDAMQLYHVLTCLSHKTNPLEELSDTPIYPYLSGLCKWENGPANCKTLDIIFVDRDYNIKTCWNGKTLGKVGMPFPEIVGNLEALREAAENSRGCRNCASRATCIKCIFPDPLPPHRFCDLKRNSNLEAAVGLIRAFDFLKEL